MSVEPDEALAAITKLAEFVGEFGSTASDRLMWRRYFPKGVEFVVVAFDPREGGAHAVTATAPDSVALRLALRAASEHLARFLAELEKRESE